MRFLLVDRVVELERGRRATGIKNVTMSEDFLADHFPERPIMPGALIAESLVQLADWVVRESTEFQCLGLATSFERLRFRRFVQPGDQLRLEVEIVEQDGREATVKGRAYLGDQLVTMADFTLGLQPAAEFLSAGESARLFEMIRAGINGDAAGGH